jgi:RNAse (barnase) inhibitor barstar
VPSFDAGEAPRRSTSSLDDVTDVSASRYSLDVGSITSTEELHALLFNVFSFPDYYGNNWDAFDECIGEIPKPAVVDVSGLFALRSRLSRDASFLMKCLNYAQSAARPGDLVVNVV